MTIQLITLNPNKMRRMNNGGRWIYKEEKGNPQNPSHHDGKSSRKGPTTRAMVRHIYNDWDSDAHVSSKILSN